MISEALADKDRKTDLYNILDNVCFMIHNQPAFTGAAPIHKIPTTLIDIYKYERIYLKLQISQYNLIDKYSSEGKLFVKTLIVSSRHLALAMMESIYFPIFQSCVFKMIHNIRYERCQFQGRSRYNSIDHKQGNDGHRLI